MDTSITTVAITDGQKKQFKRFVEDAGEKALLEVSLDKDGIQRLIGNGGQFQVDIIASIRKLSTSNQYANEEVSSNYNYPKEYTGSRSIEDRIKAVANIFDLSLTSALEY